MQYPWLTDRSGAIEALLDMASTVNEAGSLLRYIITEGQLLVHRDGARGLVEIGELAVLLSIGFESQRGVDIEERYGNCDDLGPESTHYGVAILAAFDACDVEPRWHGALAARGLVIEHFWLEDAEPLDYTLNLGHSFSRHAAVSVSRKGEETPVWTGTAAIPGLIPPPSRMRPTHTRGVVAPR